MTRPQIAATAGTWLITVAQLSGQIVRPLSAGPPPALTIEQAVQEAIEHNLSVIAERFDIAIADARAITARLRPNPVLTVNAMLPDSAIFNGGVNPKETVLRGDVLIEGGSKRERRIDVAKEVQAVAQLQLQNTVRTLVLDVQSGFVDVLLARSSLETARESMSAFDSVVRINTARVRSGDLAAVELSRSRLAALQFQNEVKSREMRLAVAANRLRVLLGRRDEGPLEVAGELRRDVEPASLEVLQRRALDGRPDLKALEREQARSAADARLQIAQGKIDYTLSAEFHRQLAPNAIAGNEWGLFMSAPLPLFNRNQGEVTRARLETRQASSRITALRTEVANDVSNAWLAYTAASAQVDTMEQQMLVQARQVREATVYSYGRGEASFVELLDAQRTFNEITQSYHEARAEYARSLYALDAATGGIQP
jgi:outer membrane protein, heavy metal efflux system